MKNEEIVMALRCGLTHRHGFECEQCPYLIEVPAPEGLRETIGSDVLHRCDTDRLGMDGAFEIERLTDRLAAYEDTGMTPERCAEFARADAEGRYIVMRDAEQEGVARLRELAEADWAGRLVVLPCKIGATVYVLIQDSAIFYPETNGWYIGEDTIDVIAQDGFYLGAVEDVDFRPNDAIGETVFLTREEAEKALEAKSND